MYAISFFIIFFTTVVAHAATPGFSQGNLFIAVPLQGTVTVYCASGPSVTYSCYDTVLDPASYDYFLGPAGVIADQITLISTRMDGSKRDRTEDYNSGGEKSASAFNLWISTPFQRPLLGLGTNKIDYKLTNMGKLVQQGNFTVTVGHGQTRTCPATHYNSADPSDCQSQYTVCQRYFEQYDYCR